MVTRPLVFNVTNSHLKRQPHSWVIKSNSRAAEKEKGGKKNKKRDVTFQKQETPTSLNLFQLLHKKFMLKCPRFQISICHIQKPVVKLKFSMPISVPAEPYQYSLVLPPVICKLFYAVLCKTIINFTVSFIRGCSPPLYSHFFILSLSLPCRAASDTKNKNHKHHMHEYTHTNRAQPHWHTHTLTEKNPEQIKAYPHTVVALQDHEGLDPKYQLISSDQWLTSQPATARLTNTTQLKAQPKARLQAACWMLYQSNDSPQKPKLCQLVSSFFSLSFSRSLSLLLFSFFFVTATNSVFFFCLHLWGKSNLFWE